MNKVPVIMVADDNPLNCELLEAQLAAQGYLILTASTGEEALTLLASNNVDLILLDVMMPGMNGFEVTKEIRANPKFRLLPIVLVTSLKSNQDRVLGIEAGCDDFISKPYHKPELLARVRSLIDVKKYNDLLRESHLQLETDVDRRTSELNEAHKDVLGRTSELKRTRMFLQLILDACPLAVVVYDALGTVSFWSQTAQKLFGWSDTEAVGQFLPTVQLQDRVRFQKRIAEIASGMVLKTIEVDALTKKGTTVLCKIDTAQLSDDNGRPTIVSIFADFSEHARLLRALTRSENRYKQIVEGISDYVYSVSVHDGSVVGTVHHPGSEKITGYSPAELENDTSLWINMVPPEDRQAVISHGLEVLSGQLAQPIEHQIVRKDGVTRWVSDTAFVRFDDQGKVQGYDGIIIDVSARRLAEKNLRDLNESLEQRVLDRTAKLKLATEALTGLKERLSLAVLAGGVGLWDYEVVEKQLFWDQQMYSLYGITASKFDNAYDAWQQSVHPEDRERSNSDFQAALSGEKEFDSVFRVVWPNGVIRYLHALAKVNRDSRGQPTSMFGTNWDITSEKMVLKQLEQAELAARVANKAKSTFLSSMSHEIRTPLNAIMGFAQLLHRDLSLTEKQNRYVSTIVRSGEHLLNLISDILAISKIEAGRVVKEEAVFDLREVIEDLHSMFQLQSHEKGLRLLTELWPSGPCFIVSDEIKIRQILLNLLSNALKFTQVGQVALRAKVDSARLLLEVEDTGVGVAPEEMGQLFLPFEQTESGRKKMSGTGLGLSISRSYAELLGGNLTATSTEHMGSVFRLELPLPQDPGQGKMSVPCVGTVTALVLGHPSYRLLIADDDKDSRYFLRDLLVGVGFEVKLAADGPRALEIFKDWRPSLVLCELHMPVVGSGPEVIQAVRASVGGAVVKIIAVTSNAFENDRIVALEVGADDYLAKPFRPEVLFVMIAALLGVEYVRAEAAVGHHAQIAGASQNLGSELAVRLIQAARGADRDLILQLTDEVESLDSRRAQQIRTLAAQYDYPRIIALLESQTEKTP